MNPDLSINELIELLIKKLDVTYGRVEIKVHDSSWTNYEVTFRVNKNESTSRDFIVEKIKRGTNAS